MNNSVIQSDRLAEQKDSKDCLSCRIIGTGTLGGVGAYAVWQSRAAASGSPLQKKGLALVGLGEEHFVDRLPFSDIVSAIALMTGGVLRWNKCQLH